MTVAVFEIVRRGTIKDSWPSFAAFPLVFLLSTAAFSVLASSRWLIILIISVTSLFFFKYYQYVYYYFHQPSLYQTFSIENISSYGNFLSFFFMGSALFGFQSFLDAPAWITVPLMALFAFLIVRQNIWACKISSPYSNRIALIVSMVMLEISWAISLLPIRYYVAGMSLAICYYAISGLLKYQLRGNLDKSIIKLYAAISFASIFIILLTAQWM